jgi:N-acylglucosamine 2-epimerase
MRSIGHPMIAIVTAQMLRADIDYEPATAIIDDCINDLNRYFLKPEIECVMEQVGTDGTILDHFDGRTLNPGHAIECAWFIMHEGKHRADTQLMAMGCRMLDWMWKRGWDEEYGGIYYFRDVYGRPVQEYWHDMKFWWPHNEAIIATLLAYSLTGEPRYRRWHQLVHDWSHRHFADVEHGEWFGYLHRDGSVSVPLKGNLWKGPFHLPRMQWYCWQLLESMQTRTAVSHSSPPRPRNTQP